MIAYYFPRRAVIFHSILFAAWKDKSNIEKNRTSFTDKYFKMSRCFPYKIH